MLILSFFVKVLIILRQCTKHAQFWFGVVLGPPQKQRPPPPLDRLSSKTLCLSVCPSTHTSNAWEWLVQVMLKVEGSHHKGHFSGQSFNRYSVQYFLIGKTTFSLRTRIEQLKNRRWRIRWKYAVIQDGHLKKWKVKCMLLNFMKDIKKKEKTKDKTGMVDVILPYVKSVTDRVTRVLNSYDIAAANSSHNTIRMNLCILRTNKTNATPLMP